MRSIHSGSRQGKHICSFTNPRHKCPHPKILLQLFGTKAWHSALLQTSLNAG